jgi:hypothetical protein
VLDDRAGRVAEHGLVVDGHDTHLAHAVTVAWVGRRGNEARTPCGPRVRR